MAGKPQSPRSSAEPTEQTPRARLIAALAESINDKGYRETTVADIVKRARTSRRTFYEHFNDRADCFLALFEQKTQNRMAEIAAAVDPSIELEAQIEKAIDVFLEGESMEPELQRSFVRELPGLPEATEVVHETLERYAAMLVALTEAADERHGPAQRPLTRDIAVILVGGLRELVVSSVQDGRDLHELREASITVVKAILAALRN